jgi:hypothetical protein
MLRDAPARIGFVRGDAAAGTPLPPEQVNGHSPGRESPKARPGHAKTANGFAIGPHSRLGAHSRRSEPFYSRTSPPAIVTLDRNTREGDFLYRYEAMLVEHLGGNPTITQAALIARTARLALHLELLDEKALSRQRLLTPTDVHFYGAWSNALSRHLAKLGFEPTKAKVKRRTLDEILADAGTDGDDER